jgi:hypothetical protein
VSLDDHVRVATDRALTDVRTPIEVALRALAEAVATEVRSSERRLPDAIRAFHKAGSLGGVLRVLADCVWREADRSAVLIVANGRLRGWHCSGLRGGETDPKAIDLSYAESGLLGTVVATGASVVSLASGPRTPATELPAFAQGVGQRDAVATPLVLGGTVAGVVYADEPAAGEGPGSWIGSVELLAQQAALVLEARTARYLTGGSLESPGECTA